MPWYNVAMKDVAWLRKASGRCLATFDPEVSEWGNLFWVIPECLPFVGRSEPGEVKHLSTQRKRKQLRFRK